MKKNIINYYGLWAIPAGGIGSYLSCQCLSPHQPVTVTEIGTGLFIGCIFSLYIWSMNYLRVSNGQNREDIKAFDAFNFNADKFLTSNGKQKAMNPPVNDALLFSTPQGYPLGKWRGKYVCASMETPGAANVLIVGGSGTGKSSAAGIIASQLMANSPSFHEKGKRSTHSLVIDLKGEIQSVTTYPSDNAIHINPLDRGSYGYDPFYALTPESTDQEIFETAQLCAISLLPHSKNENNPFWIDSSRALFEAAICYCVQNLHMETLTDVVKHIMSLPADALIAEIVENSSPSNNCYRLAIAYYGEDAAAETVGSIYSTLVSKIEVFATDRNLGFCIGNNPRKFSPPQLLDHNCYLGIPAHKLTQYSGLTVLILNQIMLFIMSLPDYSEAPDRSRLMIIIDEASALLEANRIDYLTQFLRLERSKGCMSVMVIQSYSGLLVSHAKEEAQDLISNMPYKLFLDATTPETQELVTKLTGKYLARYDSWTGYGKDRKKSTSYREEDIITTSDLAQLGSSSKMILISSIGGYCLIKKAPWYQDRLFSKLQKEIETLQKITNTKEK